MRHRGDAVRGRPLRLRLVCRGRDSGPRHQLVTWVPGARALEEVGETCPSASRAAFAGGLQHEDAGTARAAVGRAAALARGMRTEDLAVLSWAGLAGHGAQC